MGPWGNGLASMRPWGAPPAAWRPPCVTLSHTRTHTCTHARAHAHTHARTHACHAGLLRPGGVLHLRGHVRRQRAGGRPRRDGGPSHQGRPFIQEAVRPRAAGVAAVPLLCGCHVSGQGCGGARCCCVLCWWLLRRRAALVSQPPSHGGTGRGGWGLQSFVRAQGPGSGTRSAAVGSLVP